MASIEVDQIGGKLKLTSVTKPTSHTTKIKELPEWITGNLSVNGNWTGTVVTNDNADSRSFELTASAITNPDSSYEGTTFVVSSWTVTQPGTGGGARNIHIIRNNDTAFVLIAGNAPSATYFIEDGDSNLLIRYEDASQLMHTGTYGAAAIHEYGSQTRSTNVGTTGETFFDITIPETGINVTFSYDFEKWMYIKQYSTPEFYAEGRISISIGFYYDQNCTQPAGIFSGSHSIDVTRQLTDPLTINRTMTVTSDALTEGVTTLYMRIDNYFYGD